MAIEDGPLERVDLQLLSMVEDAQSRLKEDDYPIDESGIMLNGFSASGTFVDRFTVLHPDEVISVTAGGVNGMPLLPISGFDGRELPYHVGTADLKNLTGEEVDRDALNEANQFLYMGAEDENDTIPFDDAWTDDDLRQLALDVYGDNMVYERFPTSQQVYQDIEVEAQFRVYSDVGHTPRPATPDIVEFHRQSIAGEDVSEFGETIVPNAQINTSTTTASVGEEVEFDAGESTGAADAEVVTYQWDLGDGSEATGETTTFAYNEEGTFTVTLTIITARENEYQATTEIAVEATESGGENTEDSDETDDGDNSEGTGSEDGSGEADEDNNTENAQSEDNPDGTDEDNTSENTEGEDETNEVGQDGDSENGDTTDETTGSGSDGSEESGDVNNDDGSGPGFGITSVLTGVGGVAYLLKHRLSGDMNDEN